MTGWTAFLVPVMAIGALAQTPTEQAGIPPAWDMRELFRNLEQRTGRYRSLVEQLRVNEWIAKGAPALYGKQQQDVSREVANFHTVVESLMRDPERLSLALDVYLRLQSLENFTRPLVEGAKNYGSDQVAAELETVLSQNDDARFKLSRYLLDLSKTKETEYSVAEKEAQRCQTVLNRNPLAPAPKQAAVPPVHK